MNRLLSAATLAIGLLVQLADSQKLSGQEGNPSGQSEKANPSRRPYKPNAAQQHAWERLDRDHPGKNEITWNSGSKGPGKITGNNLYLETRVIDLNNVVNETRKFLRHYERLFNLAGTEIIRGHVAPEDSGRFLVQFEQAYRGVPILDSYTRFKVKLNGQIESIECKF